MSYNRTPNTVLAGRGLKQSPSQAGVVPPGVVTVTVDSDIATTTNLGVVQIGDNINVTPEGVISVSLPTANCQCVTKTVTSDYTATTDDCYIGVTSTGPVNITLPAVPTANQRFIIKVQMGPPIGNRKVTVLPQGSSTIDGASSYVMSVPYESATVIYNDGHWWII